MVDKGIYWSLHPNLLVSVLLCCFSEAEVALASQVASGVWAQKEYYPLALRLSSDTKIILDFRLSITHLFVLLPSSFYLSLILTQTRDVRFNYYAGSLPTIMSQEILTFPLIVLSFNLSYWLLCISISNSLGYSMSSSFLNPSKLGQIIDLSGTFHCQSTGKNTLGLPVVVMLLKLSFSPIDFCFFLSTCLQQPKYFHSIWLCLFSPLLTDSISFFPFYGIVLIFLASVKSIKGSWNSKSDSFLYYLSRPTPPPPVTK